MSVPQEIDITEQPDFISVVYSIQKTPKSHDSKLQQSNALVSILSWDIAGWEVTGNNMKMKSFLSKYLVLAFQETWFLEMENIVGPGLKTWVKLAQKVIGKDRAIGSLAVLLKQDLGWEGSMVETTTSDNNVLIVKNKNQDLMLMLVNVYILPISPQYYTPNIWLRLELLLQDLSIRFPSAMPILLGSFNARIGNDLSKVADKCGIFEDDSIDLNY